MVTVSESHAFSEKPKIIPSRYIPRRFSQKKLKAAIGSKPSLDLSSEHLIIFSQKYGFSKRSKKIPPKYIPVVKEKTIIDKQQGESRIPPSDEQYLPVSDCESTDPDSTSIAVCDSPSSQQLFMRPDNQQNNSKTDSTSVAVAMDSAAIERDAKILGGPDQEIEENTKCIEQLSPTLLASTNKEKTQGSSQNTSSNLREIKDSSITEQDRKAIFASEKQMKNLRVTFEDNPTVYPEIRHSSTIEQGPKVIVTSKQESPADTGGCNHAELPSQPGPLPSEPEKKLQGYSKNSPPSHPNTSDSSAMEQGTRLDAANNASSIQAGKMITQNNTELLKHPPKQHQSQRIHFIRVTVLLSLVMPIAYWLFHLRQTQSPAMKNQAIILDARSWFNRGSSSFASRRKKDKQLFSQSGVSLIHKDCDNKPGQANHSFHEVHTISMASLLQSFDRNYLTKVTEEQHTLNSNEGKNLSSQKSVSQNHKGGDNISNDPATTTVVPLLPNRNYPIVTTKELQVSQRQHQLAPYQRPWKCNIPLSYLAFRKCQTLASEDPVLDLSDLVQFMME